MRDAPETRRSAGRRAALRRLLPPNGEVDAAVGGLRIARRGRRSIQPPAMARRHRSATGLSRQTRWLAEGGSELRGSGQVGQRQQTRRGSIECDGNEIKDTATSHKAGERAVVASERCTS